MNSVLLGDMSIKDKQTPFLLDPVSLTLEYHRYGVRQLEINPAVGIS